MSRWTAIVRTSALVAVAACSSTPKAPSDLDGIDSPTTTPTKRSEILATADPRNNAIMIFGGNDGPVVDQIPSARFLDETWLFEPGTGWSQVVTDTHPSARGRYAAELDPTNDRALIYGGRWRETNTSGAYTLRTDLWSFDFKTRAWSMLDDGTADTAPHGRYYPASGYDAESETFYVWGGALNPSAVNIRPGNDLWSYAGGTWTEHTTSGDAPSTRVFFGDVYDPSRKRIVVFGGQRGDFVSSSYNDLFALDVTTGEWTKLDAGNGTAPSTRMHAHLEYDPTGDRYLLFGGHTDIGDMNDLWAFDPNAGGWTLLYEADTFDNTQLGCAGNPRDVPADYVAMDLSAPERRHRGMFSLMWDNLWLFGGIHAECSDQLDDTWRIPLAELSWHNLIDATAGESCARSGDDCACLCF